MTASRDVHGIGELWRDITLKLDINHKRVQHIVGMLNYRNICVRWFPWHFMDGMKEQWQNDCQELLKQYHHEGDDFLMNIVIGDIILCSLSWSENIFRFSKSRKQEKKNSSFHVKKKIMLFFFLQYKRSHSHGIFAKWDGN